MTKHTVTAFEEELRGLRHTIVRMGTLAEAQFVSAIQAVIERDSELAEETAKKDARLDTLEHDAATLEPSTVALTFAIQSSIREHTLDTVRVSLSGPPESYGEYSVVLEETVRRNVAVLADADLIQEIERGEGPGLATPPGRYRRSPTPRPSP